MSGRFRRASLAMALLLGALIAPQARADDPGTEYSGSLWNRENLLGPIGGLRPALGKAGIEVNLTDTETLFGNPTGGTRQSVAFQGLLSMELELDTEKAFGWKGGTFHVSGEQLHGVGLSALSVDNLNTITSVADPAQTSLYELWYDQAFDHEAVDLRIGRQAAGTEFMLGDYEDAFVNSAIGWPTLSAQDLPAGGPDYPYAFTGIRLALQPVKGIEWRTGVYDSNYAGDGFSLSGGAFIITEIALKHGSKHGKTLPGTIKIGAWYDSNSFTDQHVSVDGLSLADPAAAPEPLPHHGDVGAYIEGDQMIYRDKARNIGVFGRVMAAPEDRNLVDFFADGGMALTGMLPGRPKDIIAAGFGYARISHSRRVLDLDIARYSGMPYPIASAETFVEFGYKAEIAPWWHVQPDVQYIFNPGGGVPDDRPGHRRIPDALVLGVVSVVKF